MGWQGRVGSFQQTSVTIPGIDREVVLLRSPKANANVVRKVLVLWMHGGALTILNARDAYLLGVVEGLQRHASQVELVWASVD